MSTKKILLSIFLCALSTSVMTFAQEVDLDSFNKELENIEDNSRRKKIEANGNIQLIVSIGMETLLWNYSASKPTSQSGGSSETINESIQHTGTLISTKMIFLRPWGALGRVNIFLSSQDEENVLPSTTTNGASVVSGTEYVLKNIASDLKGVGIELLVGPNYEFVQNNITINLGGGLIWNSFTEDIGYSDRHISSIGFGIDSDFQLHLQKYFGISVGIKADYYLFNIIDTNNKIGGYTLATQNLSSLGAYIGTAWYF